MSNNFDYSQAVSVYDGDASKIWEYPSFAVTDAGVELDLSAVDFQNSRRETKKFFIFNLSDDIVRIAYNKNGADIVFSDPPFTSWNQTLLPISDPSGLNARQIDASCTKIAARTDSGVSANLFIAFI